MNSESLTQAQPQEIGEIWVKSESVANGYWNNPQATQQTFNACLADTQEEGFLRTGDLGFLKDGQLYITGRLKDLIIIRGQNYYPQDIEWVIEKCHPDLCFNASAAFSITVQREEKLVVIAEVKAKNNHQNNLDKVITKIRETVAEKHELSLYSVVLIKSGQIPKTSSGKIQRHACRQKYLQGTLQYIKSFTLSDFESNRQEEIIVSTTPNEEILVGIWQKLLNLESIGVRDNFFELGGDSLIAVKMLNEIEKEFKIELSLETLFLKSSIEVLAIWITQQQMQSFTSEELSLIMTKILEK